MYGRAAAGWAALAIVASCASPPPSAPSADGGRVVPVSVASASRRDVPIFLDGLGTVTALHTVTVRTQVDGTLQKVLFREGDEVRPGQLLALVDPRPFKAQLLQARGALVRDEAALADNRINLVRNENLFRRRLVGKESVDDQRALVGQSLGATQIDRGQIESARLNIAYSRIVSPIRGVTGIRQVDPGNVVHPGDANAIVVLTQLDPIGVIFTLPQDDLQAVKDAMRNGPVSVEIESRDGARTLAVGRLLVIDNLINANTATMRLKATAANPQHRLWPNLFVKAHLHLETRKNALVIPAAAVQRGPEGPIVFVVQPDDTVVQRAIEVEMTQGDLSLVKSGISDGERVVTEGQNQLAPGARVAIREDVTRSAAPRRSPPPRDGGPPSNDAAAPSQEVAAPPRDGGPRP